MTDRLHNWLFRPIDNSPLIAWRILYGLVLFGEFFGALVTGWVTETLVEPVFTFNFIGFEFLQVLVGPGMYAYYGVMAILALFVAVGYRYKWSMGILSVMWLAVYLMQKSHYNNHYYLMVLLNFSCLLMPLHHYASVDVRRNPALKQLTCPNWCRWFYIITLGVVYTYASIAKMYPDWFNAIPLTIWFKAKADMPILGPLLQEEAFVYLISYGGVFFDLLVVPMLLWRPTRWIAVGLSATFHLFNSVVFGIGTFPYTMLSMLVFFFPPASIRKLFFRKKPLPDLKVSVPAWNPLQKLVVASLGMFFLVQILLPLRHHLYPGNVHWTEEGHRLAWHMMLRAKGGSATVRVEDTSTGKSWRVRTSDFLTRNQARKFVTRPEMAWQFAQHLETHYRQQGIEDVAVYVNARVRLNGRKPMPLIDPEVDLTSVEWDPIRPSSWILPLPEGLEPQVNQR
ncbi:MAG: HTTM domain-containing protein [Bacteroidota bacterium]